jgi:toxin ParE1/3/4
VAASIFKAARARLIEVWEYSETTWGAAQADKYLRAVVAAIESIQDEPRRWRPVRDKALPGIFYFRHKHHTVFFRRLSKGQIGVITVLHESMNLPARLREDLAVD